ncbi:MAG: hypothetical protein LHV69_04515 [Elusimicrobia bacterium]|nr:hypothetical protein [Candidatus Obscuribacterium magneticum]
MSLQVFIVIPAKYILRMDGVIPTKVGNQAVNTGLDPDFRRDDDWCRDDSFYRKLL